MDQRPASQRLAATAALTGLIARSLAHCAYHVGQIVETARVLAGENWETLTIPRGQSASYNRRVWDQAPYAKGESGGEDGRANGSAPRPDVTR